MKCRLSLSLLFATVLLLNSPVAPFALPEANADVKGCADHPLFTRMNNTHIVSCKATAFDSFKFKTDKATDTTVEGKKFEIKYQTDPTVQYAGALAIIRNHQDAVSKIGGKVLFEDPRYTWVKVAKDDKEIWAQVDTAWNKGYMLTIIEKQAMAQEVVASAELFKNGLKTSGHVEVPGIFFDTGKADLKLESQAAIAEVANNDSEEGRAKNRRIELVKQ